MVAHGSVANRKPKAELDSHADTCVVDDDCAVIHYHDRLVNIYTKVGYQNKQCGQKYFFMIHQAIQTSSLGNHLLCPMHCHLNSVYISEVPKFLADTPSVTTHAIHLADLFNPILPLIISPELSSVTSYFDVYSKV